MSAARPHRLALGLAALTLALLAASTAIGYARLDLSAAVADWAAGRETMARIVLVELRLPRAITGALVGFSLGIVGAALQGLLRNPLADPGIIGVSAAAALGAVIAFYTGLAATFALALPLGGIAGAFASTFVVYALAGRGTGTMGLILAGVALSSLCGALTALALNLSPNPYAAMEIVFWLMGSLADRSWDHVALAVPPMVLGWAITLTAAPALDALTLGEETAESLGYRITLLRAKIVAGAALAVGPAVAVAGAIGFVGLVAPHLMRPLVGHRPGRLLVVSGLAGAALTVGADTAVRLIPVRPELKLGVVTALIGAPFLFALILRLRRSA